MSLGKLSFINLLSSDQISVSDVSVIFSLAKSYEKGLSIGVRKHNDCDGYILATLFFESSTRTRFSFESAILRLGGNIVTLEQGLSSSVKKGESLSDMGRIIDKYADLIVIRHPEIGSVVEFSKYCSIPVINGGDGSNEHPTQSLTDLYTINQQKNRLDNLVIGLVGDLKYGRTIYSLLKLMNLYSNNKFILVSHPLSKIDNKRREALQKINCQIEEVEDLDSVISELDVLYVTRVQRERFDNENEYQKVKNKYCVDSKILQKAKKNLIVMHPLPRGDEISVEVDDMDQAKYFCQAQNSLFVRMALLNLMK